MIQSFRHRGLRRLYERGDPSRIGADQLDRITLTLADLDVTSKPSELDLPGYRLHPLRGALHQKYLVLLNYPSPSSGRTDFHTYVRGEPVEP